MPANSNASNNMTVVREIFDAFNSRDFFRAATHIAKESEWIDFPSHTTRNYQDGYIHFAENLVNAFPDCKVEIANLFADDNGVVVEYIFRGTNTGPLFGYFEERPPTGRRVELQCCDVYYLQNGKVIRRDGYYDLETLKRQLGEPMKVMQVGEQSNP